MGEGLKFILYFIIGGSILTLVTYFGSKDKGILAAFIALFPMVSLMSILTIYSEAGNLPVLDYVKGLLILTPLWIIFLLCVTYLLSKQGLFVALVIGIAIYIIISVLLITYLNY
jgi:uncharacterized membrane protein (GlpM family)